jgi:hypothetical protein
MSFQLPADGSPLPLHVDDILILIGSARRRLAKSGSLDESWAITQSIEDELSEQNSKALISLRMPSQILGVILKKPDKAETDYSLLEDCLSAQRIAAGEIEPSDLKNILEYIEKYGTKEVNTQTPLFDYDRPSTQNLFMTARYLIGDMADYRDKWMGVEKVTAYDGFVDGFRKNSLGTSKKDAFQPK